MVRSFPFSGDTVDKLVRRVGVFTIEMPALEGLPGPNPGSAFGVKLTSTSPRRLRRNPREESTIYSGRVLS